MNKSDLQYLFNYRDFGCSGYCPEMYPDLHILLNKHIDLFQVSFQTDNYIWTHAGIHKGWYEYRFQPKVFELGIEHLSLSEQLNYMFQNTKYTNPLFDVGKSRGGFNQVGGIFWADRSETWDKPLENYHQIVGHSVVKDIMSNKIDNNTSITYIDCIDKPYILEI